MPCGGLKIKQYTYLYIQHHSVPAKMNVKITEPNILYYNNKKQTKTKSDQWRQKIGLKESNLNGL